MNLESSKKPDSSFWSGRKFITPVIGIVLLVMGFGVAFWLLNTKPKPKPKQKNKTTPIVEVYELMPSTVRVKVKAMGTVISADEVYLQSEVTGRINWVHPEFVEGGFVEKNEILVKIDERNYSLNLKKQKANLQNALASLSLEEGHQKVAFREWEYMSAQSKSENPDNDLALRKPQLKAARAAYDLARAGVEQAKLDLERTKIKSPFNAVILEASADVGDMSLGSTVLARLISTDKFYIKASVNPDQLKWLKFPEAKLEKGSTVLIYPPSSGIREGNLIKLAPELSQKGKMAQVMIKVSDPLLLKSMDNKYGGLLLKELVKLEIIGIQLDNIVRIPRTALREGVMIHTLNDEKKLEIIKPVVLWSNADELFVENNYSKALLIITSYLASPVEGMSLAVDGDKSPEKIK
jgi:multidrug efflux pump subunit AcrA (membrane-fusion protein)